MRLLCRRILNTSMRLEPEWLLLVGGLLVGDRRSLAEAGVLAPGVVSGQPAEGGESRFTLGWPAFRPLSVRSGIVCPGPDRAMFCRPLWTCRYQ